MAPEEEDAAGCRWKKIPWNLGQKYDMMIMAVPGGFSGEGDRRSPGRAGSVLAIAGKNGVRQKSRCSETKERRGVRPGGQMGAYMKRYRKYICGVVMAAVLLGAGIRWPMQVAASVENAQEQEAGESQPGGMSGTESGSGLDSASGTESGSGLDSASGTESGSGLDSASGTESGSGLDSASGTESGSGLEGEAGTGASGGADGASRSGNRAGEGPVRTAGNLDEETEDWIQMAGEALTQIAAQRDIMALVYLNDEYPVRVSPSYESDAAVTVLSGQMVNILDLYVDQDMEVWHYVRLDYQGTDVYGYVPRLYLASSDERFLEWEEQYGLNLAASTYAVDGERASYADIEQFPESYRPALNALKEQHPNWIFVVMKTNLDWDTVIYNELQGGRSLVYKTFPEWAKQGLYDQGNWYYSSEAALKLYMDPRNSLTENAIFQFEQLTFNETYHTQEVVTSFLDKSNSFMKSSAPAPGTSKTYAQLFYNIGREEGVSPFHLASRVIQEQGQGTSQLISGTYPGYVGYYNYFNISASGQTDKEVIESGLKYAKSKGWTDAEKSIRGGTNVISANYIKRGQDTLYLEKFNVTPNNTYNHQYMQNISAPTSEALTIKNLYKEAGALGSAFVFKIPVYENMPGTPCGIPEVSTDVVLKLPAGYSDATVWLDGVACAGEVRNGSLIAVAPDTKASTAVVYKYNDSGVPTGMYVWSLSHNGTVYTAAAQPGLEDLLTYHGFSIRVTGKTGIRFKTGISAALRAQLTAGGVDGYRLKEYGTLVMNQANMDKYPMVKGGEKVSSGVSYGVGANGKPQDVVFETVDGRYRFTSVLVGLPVEQYQTEFAFRGYAVLEKNGTQVTIYGPARARSIYDLAKQLIEIGSYPEGSASYEFLKKLIGDADALKPSGIQEGIEAVR